MQTFVDATKLHVPGSLLEAVLLFACLVAGALAAYRLGRAPFSVLFVVAQYSGFLLVGHVAIPLVAACAILVASARRAPPVRPGDFLLQCSYLGAGMVLYQFGRIASEGGWGEARANGLRVLHFEDRLGLYVEPDLQDWLAGHAGLADAFNTFYSFGFLAIVSGVLVYLYLADRRNFLLLRNCLGLSAAMAVVVIALYPTAPPRMLPEAGLIDTVVAQGRQHNFTNEFAAIPSLHVGWIVLSSYILSRSIGGRARVPIAILPGVAMLLTVITTGNHFWFDGAVGTLLSVMPALLATRLHHVRGWIAASGWRVELQARTGLALSRGKARFTIITLSGLLTYLTVAEILSPGFTDFWGYLVFQMAMTLVILVGFEIALARQGGISWPTHVVAVSCGYLDVFGTAGDLYAHIDEYDKITHFMGVAAMSSGAYDVFRALHRSGSSLRVAEERFLAAVSFGTGIGIAWEVYEFLGDKVFHSTRVQGRWDTANDLVSDFLGAVTVVLILKWLEHEHEPEPVQEDNLSPAPRDFRP